MSTFDTPNISFDKSNEENIQATKGYLADLAQVLNIKFNELEERVSALESIISSLEGSK